MNFLHFLAVSGIPDPNTTPLQKTLRPFWRGLVSQLLSFYPNGANHPNNWPNWATPVLLSFVGLVALFIGIRWFLKAAKRVK